MSELNIKETDCHICEKPHSECDCCSKCPKCHGEMDVLDASICIGCDSYYGDCTCK